MKKIIGILGVAALAMTLFFSTNSINNNNKDLASLIAMNTANAENWLYLGGCKVDKGDSCTSGTTTQSGCDESSLSTCKWYY